MYSTLMVHLEMDKDNSAILGITGDLAERFDADVMGIVACQPMATVVGDGILSGEVIERDRADLAAQAKAVEASFRAALKHRSRGLEWRSQLNYDAPTEYIVQQMRGADLLVTGVDFRGSWLDATWHVDTADLVMQIGRPTLIVPAQARKLVANNILVGWKDTRETRRAVSDALPFLRTAKRIVVAEVVADDDGIPDGRRHTREVCDWLGRHDIEAEPIAVVADDDVAPLDALARREGADLIVAGAYGHTRFHEWALGGVTRDLLRDSGRCSLLSH